MSKKTSVVTFSDHGDVYIYIVKLYIVFVYCGCRMYNDACAGGLEPDIYETICKPL